MISSLSALLTSRLSSALRFGGETLTGGFFFILFADCRCSGGVLV
jgi:hypothetical protein